MANSGTHPTSQTKRLVARSMRQSKDEIRATLDTLDRTAAAGASNRRGADRYVYRARCLLCAFQGPAGAWEAYSLPSRDISDRGMGLLAGQFVYPGTQCVIQLVSIYNHTQAVQGKVAHCRYIRGTTGIHQVGIRFNQPIDVAMFHREACHSRILVVDEDEMIRNVVQRFLRGTNIEPVCVTSAAAGVEAAQHLKYDVVLMDLDLSDMDGFSAVRALRNSGYFRPVVAFTLHTEPPMQAKLLEAGFNDWVVKPFTRDSLIATIRTLKDEPLVTSLIHDRSLHDLIDAFVASLEARVKELEVAYCDKRFDAVQKEVRRLKGEAGTYGFEVITSAAADVEQCLAAGERDLQAVRSKLSQLSRLCLAARPVSCLVRGDDASER